MCLSCRGLGKIKQRIPKRVRLQYQKEVAQFQQSNLEGAEPVSPKGHWNTCATCSGTGLLLTTKTTSSSSEEYPHVAIIGGGIGGVALAVACLHRGIPFTLFERDATFEARSQGYGLTLQQASKAMEGLGIVALEAGVVSTRHVVHTVEGIILGEWGIRKWEPSKTKIAPKRTNIHIARQLLRQALIDQLGGKECLQWGHQFVACQEREDGIELEFVVNGELKSIKTDLLVGADGIRSAVRKAVVGDEIAPLRYLGCIVILGICPLSALEGLKNNLLDGATVFQTANGNERIYIMPYTADAVMWQLSFPMDEDAAKQLSAQGSKVLKTEALRRTQWHDPIPQILLATDETLVSGYPVYDRELLTPEILAKANQVTLLGDAAHPMSPFKGQGANQALLDALSLARTITKGCGPKSDWRAKGIRAQVLTPFESEMLARSAVKVKDSAAAAEFLHSDVVLHEADEPRGRCLLK
ncbi:FAD-dependent oxidoreductase [Flavobacterium sp. TSSA_36]|uniref:FAD-dependent oxidoreductase n=1 Tax=Flavobacterium sp. TSSA_36 TaxID=3447669 RepID=UPI003F3ECB4D